MVMPGNRNDLWIWGDQIRSVKEVEEEESVGKVFDKTEVHSEEWERANGRGSKPEDAKKYQSAKKESLIMDNLIGAGIYH